MAFTKTPVQSSFETKNIMLAYDWDNRKATDLTLAVDSKQTVAQNVVFEVVQNQTTGESYYHAIKRDGSEVVISLPSVGYVGETILGIHYWDATTRLVVVSTKHIGIWDSSTGGLISDTAYTGFTNTTVGVNFVEFLYTAGTSTLIISDGFTFGELNAANVFTECVDPDRPSQFNNFPVFMDGYLFLSQDNGNIVNSDLNNPLSWSPSNFISADSYPDRLKGLARVGTYLVALGSQSCQWYYDAGNPTGTPLAIVQGATQQIGYIQGLVSGENEIYFVGKGAKGAASVYKIAGLKITDLGSPTARRWLNTTSVSNNNRGHIITMNGHRFFMVILNRDNSPIQTYLMDLENNMWSSMTLGADTAGAFFFSSTQAFVQNITASYAQSTTWLSVYGARTVLGFRSDLYKDSNVNYTVKFTTQPQDFGTYRIKFGARLLLACDQTASSSLCSVSWSDNDLTTFSTPRTVDLQYQYTQLYALGSFRKRSWQITYTDAFPMRWRSIELDYDQGSA